MVISIRRSRHEEGRNSLRFGVVLSMPLTIFYQQSIGPSWKSWCIPFCRKHRCGSRLMSGIGQVGFMLLSGQHMDALFIDPDVRGCGVGRMLVKHALSMAPELTTNVNEQNEQAVGFYKKVGFKVTGRSEVDDLGKPYPLLNLAYVGV